MSNQRSGTWKPATLRDGGDSISIRDIIRFARSAKEMLEIRGEADSAFYFEQIEEWLTENPGKGLKDAGHVLGL